jgi:hypothetical protein
VALRVRWYLATASLTATGRTTNAVVPRVAVGAHVRSLYAPSSAAPTAALVRVLQEGLQHVQMENGANFDTDIIRLRVGGLWANVTRTPLLNSLLDAFGFRYADITETFNLGVIIRLGLAVSPGFNPDLEQYATAED